MWRELHQQDHELSLWKGLSQRRSLYQSQLDEETGRIDQSRLGEQNHSVYRTTITDARQTGTRGFGLFTTEDIKEGDFVTDYRGEVSQHWRKALPLLRSVSGYFVEVSCIHWEYLVR
jgi:SET domain-containing protein